MRDAREQPAREFVLVRARQLFASIRPQQQQRVVVLLETESGTDLVGRDEIQALALQLAARARFEVFGFRREADHERSRRQRGDLGHDVGILHQRKLERRVAVLADLVRRSRLRAEIADSGGRHVRAGIEGGQVIEVTVDTRWAERVRYSEVESELLDALRQAQRRADPGDLTRGPQSTEISELMNLVNNPQELLRQLGLGN